MLVIPTSAHRSYQPARVGLTDQHASVRPTRPHR